MTGRLSAAVFAGLVLLAGCTSPPQQQAPADAPANPPLPPVQAVPLDTRADGSLAGKGAAAMPTDQTTPALRAEMEAAAAAAGMPVTAQTRTSFKCDNDETIEVRIFPEQGVAVLVRGGQNVELQQEQVASGFKFSNGQTTLTGEGDSLTMQVGMMAPAACTAA